MTPRLAIDMTGQRYGSLVAIRRVGTNPMNGNATWLLRCDCGQEREADGYDVRRGKIIDCHVCGAERLRLATVTHSMSDSAEFKIWTGMLTRCYNARSTSYASYGGRGISVCDRWRVSFDAFLMDLGARPGPTHSIERNDVNGNYEPGNCCWATASEQAMNRRNTLRINVDGLARTIPDLAAISGLPITTLYQRVRAGKAGSDLLKPSRLRGTITFNGITDTHAGWSQRTGIKVSTIAMRLTKYQWPIEKALTTGARL